MIAKHYDIRKSVPVVIYDCQAGWFAHRACFMIKSFGHPNVRVLDGGFWKWKADGGETVHTESASADDSSDYAYELVPEYVTDYHKVKQASHDNSKQIIDCRAPEMFAKAAIPNAKNIFGVHF